MLLLSAVRALLRRRKYEVLLAALLLHLFNAVVLPDLGDYTQFFWPFDMVLLGISSYGIFVERSRTHRIIKNVLTFLVVGFPMVAIAVARTPTIMAALSICYAAFYVLVFVEVLRHLIRPSYINADLVSAAICGYLLLLEIGIFVMQILYYSVPNALRHVDTTSFTTVYLDIVYYCAIVLTSIGFGDILPGHHITKLVTAILGIAGQLYLVVLVGIIISKYGATGTTQP